MEVLYFLKLWKPKGHPIENLKAANVDDEEDSFFELDPTSDSISKRKILPFESPRSSPSFNILPFKRSKSVARSSEPFHLPGTGFRYGSSPGTWSQCNDSREEAESKLMKYLKLVRPFYVRMLRRRDAEARCGASPYPSRSPFASPGWESGNAVRVVCRRLAVSKNACAAAVGRRDDSLQLHNDGIQGAILYCKNSFNSSKESEMTRFGVEVSRRCSEVSVGDDPSDEVYTFETEDMVLNE